MTQLFQTTRFLFAITIFIFGVMNFMYAPEMVGIVPSWLPGGVLWVYLMGATFFAIAGAILLKKKARLAALIFAALMLLFVLTVYLPKVLNGDMTAWNGLLKDVLIGAGAIEFAKNQPLD
jgi:uncharacterized membrane protein